MTSRSLLNRLTGEGPFPLHVFFHGGGFCLGDTEGRDNRCRDLAADVGCVVASVDYRLAPEHPFPTAPRDCYAALCWLVGHAGELGLDRGRVSVGGESAGATLAAVMALMARDLGGPALVFQLLDVPLTDWTCTRLAPVTAGARRRLAGAGLDLFRRHYLPRPGQAEHPYASPLLAADHAGLPAALVVTAEFDPIREHGEAYARRLSEAGVPTDTRYLPGHLHQSFAFTRLLPSSREHHRACVTALRRAFS
jgi:acetyl esterase